MNIPYLRTLGAASVLAVWLGTVGGCSEAEEAPPNFGTVNWGGTAGSTADATGSSGTSGTSGGSDAASRGGSGGNPLNGSTITACTGASSIDPSAFKACPLCAGARCVPAAAVPAGQGDILSDCAGSADAGSADAGSADAGPAEKCVPDAYVSLLGNFLAKTCRSLLDAEGRCISTCVPQVASQKDQLPVADCAAEERCAPCFNPIDGIPSGACTTGCDTGAKEPPKTFPECGNGRGVCVPQALVPAALLASVPQATCPAGELCAPKEKAKDQNFKFPKCDPPAIFPILIDPTEGACVPAYIVKPDQVAFLQQHTCAAGELCAPCVNPLDNITTGACS